MNSSDSLAGVSSADVGGDAGDAVEVSVGGHGGFITLRPLPARPGWVNVRPCHEGEHQQTRETGNMTIFAITRHTGVRIAEIGFALLAIAGALLAIAPFTRFGKPGTLAGGIGITAGAVVIIVAIRWGSFGSVF